VHPGRGPGVDLSVHPVRIALIRLALGIDRDGAIVSLEYADQISDVY
jgi:hypothetical protein